MTNRKSFLKELCSFCLIGAALCFVCAVNSSSCSAQGYYPGYSSYGYNPLLAPGFSDLYLDVSRSLLEVFNNPSLTVPWEDRERAYVKRQAQFNKRFGNNPFEKPSALGDSGVETPEEREKFRKEWGFLPPNHTETEYREIGQTAIVAALFVELGAPASKAKEAKMEKLFRICKEAYDRANPNGPSFENALLKISENEYDWGMSNVEHKIHYANLARRYSIQHSEYRYQYDENEEPVSLCKALLEDILHPEKFEIASGKSKREHDNLREISFSHDLKEDLEFVRYISQKYGNRDYDQHEEFRRYIRKKLGDETYKEFMQISASPEFPAIEAVEIDLAMDYLLLEACRGVGIFASSYY